jgi:hypothetical protein
VPDSKRSDVNRWEVNASQVSPFLAGNDDFSIMDTVVIIVLVALGVTAVIGVVVMYFAVRKAPNGFEDDQGFHSDRKPKP